MRKTGLLETMLLLLSCLCTCVPANAKSTAPEQTSARSIARPAAQKNPELQKHIQVHKADSKASPNSHLVSIEDRPGPIRIPCFGGPVNEPSHASLPCGMRDVLYLQTDLNKTFSSVDSVIKEYGAQTRKRLAPVFAAAGVPYPPQDLTLVALKKEKQLYLFARDEKGKEKFLKSYPIIGLSGNSGPKLKEGDKQVPEGFYRISALRPTLIAHMGLGVDYPNAEDRTHALKEKRKNLGGDILIHGSMWSTGCLAMGNPAIHELFVLAYDSGYKNVKLVFSPCNLLLENLKTEPPQQPAWLPDLYERIRQDLKQYPFPQLKRGAN